MKRRTMETNKQFNSNTLAVRDLNIAAFLMSSGQVKLAQVERHLDKTTFFHFEPKELAENLVASYWAEDAPSIQPKKLLGSLRDLKDILFSGGSG